MKKKTSLDSSETLSSHQLYDDIINWSVVQLLMPELEVFFFFSLVILFSVNSDHFQNLTSTRRRSSSSGSSDHVITSWLHSSGDAILLYIYYVCI